MSFQESTEVTKLVRQRSIRLSVSSIGAPALIDLAAKRGCETTNAVFCETGSATMALGITHIQRLLFVETGVLGFAIEC